MSALIIIVLAGLVLVGVLVTSVGRRRVAGAGRGGDAMDVLARIVAQNQAQRSHPAPGTDPQPGAQDGMTRLAPPVTQPFGPLTQALASAPTVTQPVASVPEQVAPVTQRRASVAPPLPLLAHPVAPPPPSLAGPLSPPTEPVMAPVGPSTDRIFLDDYDTAQHVVSNTPVETVSLPATGAAPPPWWSEIRLAKQTVAVLAAVVVAAGAGMAAILGTSGPTHRSLSSATTAPLRRSAPPSTVPKTTNGGAGVPAPRLPAPTTSPTTWPPTAAPSTTVPTITASPTTAVPPGSPPPSAAPGGAPVIVTMSPASGSGGQSLTLSGSGFFSQGGHIRVMFAGSEASAACPTRTTCTVTVPALAPPAGQPGPQSVAVVVATDTGTSNSVNFTYV